MTDNDYQLNIDDFLRAHPEIEGEVKKLAAPIFQGAEDQLFTFIMTYIFM